MKASRLDLEDKHQLAFALKVLSEGLEDEPTDLHKDVMGSAYYRQFRVARDDVEITLDMLCHGPLAEVIPPLARRARDENHLEMQRTARNFSVHIHGTDCQICSRSDNVAKLALTKDGFSMEDRKLKRGRHHIGIEYRDLMYLGVSAGYNFKHKRFHALGRELPLVDQSYYPQRDLSLNRFMWLSELASDLRNTIVRSGHNTDFSSLHVTDTVVGRLTLSKSHTGRVYRWKKMQLLPLSQYVALAVIKPTHVGMRGQLDGRDFWDWMEYTPTDTDDTVVARRKKWFKGLCSECWLQAFREESISQALVSSGQPDPLIRLNSDYYEDLQCAVVEAEDRKKLRIIVVEPLTNRDKLAYVQEGHA